MADAIRDEVIIAVADLSGSMAGPAISKINVQLSELLSELQSMQKIAANSIRLGILGFHEKQIWFVRPQEVKQIYHLPKLTPGYDSDQLGLKSDFAGMLAELNRCMTAEFLCGPRDFNQVHVLLFTDGCPTDRPQLLDRAMKNLKKNQIFAGSRVKRYVIQERTEGIRLPGGDTFLNVFADRDQNVVSADDFSVLLSDITNELEGIKKMSSVFD